MPYIEPKDRNEVINGTGNIDIAYTREDLGIAVGNACRNGGDLQYILAVAIDQYIRNNGLRYQYCQDIMGALAGAQQEFYRCVVGPYEDKKIADNGEVYNLENYTSKGY